MKNVEQGIEVVLKDLQKSYGEREVLKGIDLKIDRGRFISIVGKSGCGKSTLLRLLAGLEKGNGGSILLDNKPLAALNEKARIMFQDGRLLPWKRVIDNVCLGLTKEDKEKAEFTLEQVGLKNRIYDYPAQLSGGQKQRVALARALVHDPSLLLLDEPLGALDALTRIEMQELIEELWKARRFTSILVTHDVEEAVCISDRVILIEDGRVHVDLKIDLPRPRLRSNPAFSMYVEEILGKIMNRKQKYLLVANDESLFYSVNNKTDTEENPKEFTKGNFISHPN